MFIILLAHLSHRLIGELIVYTYRHPASVRQHFQTTSPLKPLGRFFHITHIAFTGRGNEKLCFYSGRIRTLFAMATYSFHKLIMGKVEIDNFY